VVVLAYRGAGLEPLRLGRGAAAGSIWIGPSRLYCSGGEMGGVADAAECQSLTAEFVLLALVVSHPFARKSE